MRLSLLPSSLVSLFLVLISTTCLWAQVKCGTVPYEALRKEKSTYLSQKNSFEQWLARKINQEKAAHTLRTKADESLIIPVVVHVVHNGEPVGTGANLADSRIHEQIKILNADFRRLNADTVNTPEMFKPVASDTHIEFRLAKRDPEGLATDGIVRLEGSQSTYAMEDHIALKSESYWPAEDYLNIWVAQLDGMLLGFAQFPVSDLEGLEAASKNRATDGVVITSEYFGINNEVSPESRGRTATHEIGHFLGLRHIWGDGGCDVDDFCEDTPPAATFTSGCPTEKATCNTPEMFQNYMDFSNDACMNIFTDDQNERIQAVMLNSPRRASLLASKGSEEPVVVSNDAGIRAIIRPLENSCSDTVTPEIQVRNYGNNTVNHVTIRMLVDDQERETISQDLNLAYLETANIAFPALKISTGANTVSFEIIETNGTSDNNPNNDSKFSELFIAEEATPPIKENFDALPGNWFIDNPDQDISWQLTQAPEEGPEDTALFINFYNYERGVGERDLFMSPSIQLDDLLSAELEFKVAYAEYAGGSNDGLLVAISMDCGNTFGEDNIIYQKFGGELSTASDTDAPFVPEDRLDWRLEKIDLSSYIDKGPVRIAFIGQNDYGNNLYLDDIAVNVTERFEKDIAIAAVQPFISCNDLVTPEVEIKNFGLKEATGFQVAYKAPDGEVSSFTYSGPPVATGKSIQLPLPSLSLPEGKHEVEVVAMLANAETDSNSVNNQLEYTLIVNSDRDRIPLRERFSADGFSGTQWLTKNPDKDVGWEIIKTYGNNYAAFVNNSNYENTEAKDWLISPALDFSDAAMARLYFDRYHIGSKNFRDSLKVLVSTDCGETFPYVAYAKTGSTPAERSISEPGPAAEEDWTREFVNLDQFAGRENIRIAFVSFNGNGNNLYLDNIEFFVGNASVKVETPVNLYTYYPNPVDDVLNLTFNLDQKEHITTILYDVQGKIIFKEEYPNTLNQTYMLHIEGLNKGLYLLKVSGNSFNTTSRIIITP